MYTCKSPNIFNRALTFDKSKTKFVSHLFVTPPIRQILPTVTSKAKLFLTKYST